ncbi:hypothetical protein ACFXD5_11930 [Streptomyces sp. NPDC059385]|uniref:hypothetical protein n=1 Tax=Streptomyces sp. NPDC059385 TaxID=3346817 RepID=UPI0036799421
MSFPAGTPTVTLVGKIPSAVAGTDFAGLIDCRPSAYLVDSTRHAVYPGGGKVNFASDGTFSVVLLPCDAAGVQPEGWRWHLDLQPKGGRRIQFYANIVGTGTVHFDTLTPVPAPGGGSGGGGGGAVSSVNGKIGAVVLNAADVDADPEGTAAAAVTAHAAATDPHGDRAAAAAALASHEADTTSVHGIANTANLVVTSDPRLSDARTPAAHAASHAAAGSDPVSLSQSQISGLLAALAALLAKAGGTMTGDLTVDGANLTVARADDTGAYRLRVTGGGLDFEIGGLDVFVSHWQNADFTGTQSNLMRWEAAGPHMIGRTQFGTNPFDTVHDIDATTGVAAVGKKNSLSNIRWCGRRASTGAPTSGTWATGDTVQDSAGAFWLCTAGGTPGTWVGGGAADPWVFDVTASAYGAVGNGQVVNDGAMTATSATLTSATANFQPGDVGKAISVKGAAVTGVTTLVTTISARISATQVTLAAQAATTVTNAVVIWGTDDTAAIQAAVDAAEAYLATGKTYAQVYFPPRPYVVAGPLSAAKSGNGQIVFGPIPTSGVKRILEFRGEGDGAAAVRHWEQTVPQYAGSCLLSLGVYASTSAQITSINNDGNPGVISGPNEGSGYGVAAAFSNMQAVIKNLAILTAHSAYGLTYGAANLWGCANAHVENVGYGTAGTVASPSTDYTSPGTFGTGLSVGFLLPAPGNNDHVVATNLSCGGGYTYALFLTEHAVVNRYMALYSWAGLCPVGSYAGSVGSVHAMDVISASIEACINEVYVVGVGSEGVGPAIYANVSTESSTPNITGNSSAAMKAALGTIRLTGLFTESGVSISDPTGIEIVNGQVPRAIKWKTGAFTCSPIDRTLICDTTAGGAFTGTLPSADVNPVEYVFKNVGGSSLTVATTSSQLIYTTSGTGATTATVATGQTLRVQALYNGSSWGWYAV